MSNAATVTPEYRAARAASVFVAAFNTVYEDDQQMRLTLHRGDGTSLAVTGELTPEWAEAFNAEEVATFLGALSTAIADDPEAVISVASWLHTTDSDPVWWAWRIEDGQPLEAAAAAALLGDDAEYEGAEQPWVRIGTDLMDVSDDGLSCTALTDDVKAALSGHRAA
jgi:hypothetical protein